MKQFDTVYLDNNATTPVAPEVRKEIEKYLNKKYGNPNSLHRKGMETREAVEKNREKIASLINASEDDIYFTSCATEANNTALKGTAFERKEEGKHIITTEIEHDCVLNTAKWLEKQGFEVTYLEPDKEGFIRPEQVENALKEDTILVSIILANNEIGTIQPMKNIAEKVSKTDVYLHTDAAQAAGKIELDVKKLGVDMMTVNAHKMYGPKGIGALWKKREARITPLLHGGGQEKGMRSGTENVSYIAGFGKAAEIAEKNLEKDRKKLKELSEKLIKGIEEKIERTVLNGPKELEKRLPGNVNVSIRGVEGEAVMLHLDDENIQVSTGSACASESLEPSHVISALGQDTEVAHSSIRLGIGRYNTKEDIEKVLETLPSIVEELRNISSLEGK